VNKGAGKHSRHETAVFADMHDSQPYDTTLKLRVLLWLNSAIVAQGQLC
jgi:hypothetical protein